MKYLVSAAILLGVSFMGLAGLLPAAFGDGVSDAQINESVSVYIPEAGNSMLLVKGTPAQVLTIVGDNAVISLTLQNGYSVQTQINTKYLNILPPKQDPLAGLVISPARKPATFNIDEIRVHNDPTDLQDDDMADLQEGIKAIVNGHNTLVPQIEVVVKTSKDFHSQNLFARAYFLNGSNQKIEAYTQPSLASHSVGDDNSGDTHTYIWPTILPQNQRQTIYFPLPDKLPDGWKVVIVFGTSKGAVSAVYPKGNEKDFNYPEQKLVEKTALDPDQDIADTVPLPTGSPGDSQEQPTLAASPPDNAGPPPLLSSDGHKIVSLDVENEVPNLPVMTFYVRYPKGLSPKDKVDGVFAYVTYMTEKKNLEAWVKRPSSDDLNFQFADQHKLVVVTWNTAEMYNNGDSFTVDAIDEREPDNAMEQCFRTWKTGMDRLCRDYNLPDSGYLIYGFSRGAQWAHRIVLRSPEKFLAVHIHVNSSFAEPTPKASHCLWLITTGELEHGSIAARVFYQKGLALNYPILLRIYPGKGHEVFPEEEQLGIKFFEYVLKLRDQQLKAVAAKQSDSVSPDSNADAQPFVLNDSLLGNFRQPPYYGDMLNGDVYPAIKESVLPESQRVDIPDLDIAKTWGYFHP
jgi:predicted esterase